MGMTINSDGYDNECRDGYDDECGDGYNDEYDEYSHASPVTVT